MLLNELDGVVALDEPFAREALSRLDAAGFADLVEETFACERRMILESGKAHSTKAIGDRASAITMARSPAGPGCAPARSNSARSICRRRCRLTSPW